MLYIGIIKRGKTPIQKGFTTMINNIPERTEAYIVAREIDGEFWFYATFADGDKANACADEIGGVVFSN